MSLINRMILCIAISVATTTYKINKNGVQGDELERIVVTSLITMFFTLIINPI